MKTKFDVGDYAWIRVKVTRIKIDDEGIKYMVHPTNAFYDFFTASMVIDEGEMAEETGAIYIHTERNNDEN